MNWGAHKVDGRIAAKAATKIRAALRQSIDAKRVYQLYKESDPAITDNEAQDNARARAWAMLNVRPNNNATITALQYLWAEAFVLGEDSAREAIREAREAKKEVSAGIDWDKWKAGDRASALLITPPRAFQRLLEKQGVAIKGLDQTGYDRIGTALARSIRLGLGDTNAAKLINDAIGSPARALSIAITETNRAVSLGAIKTYREAKLEKMEWAVSDPCPECAQNSGQVIDIGGTFNSGAQQPPAHPHCRCALLPVIPDYETNEAGVVDVAPKPQTVGDYARPTKQGFRDYEEMLESQELSDDLRYATQRWQGEDYRKIQGALSGGRPSGEIAEIIDALDDAMMPLDDAPGFLYRGQTEGLQDLVVGDKFRSPLYQAATTDPITAAGFSKSSGSVTGGIRQGEKATILRIEVFDAKGVVVPDSSEMEVILARNTTFEVYKIEEVTIDGVDLRIIDVEAVSK